MTICDRHGLAQTGTPDGVDLFDRAVSDWTHYAPTMLESPQEAYDADPDAPMVNVLRAYQSLMTTERRDLAAGRREVAGYLDRQPLDRMLPREQAHFAVVEALGREDLHGASRLCREISRRWPRDLLALFFGHGLDFFTGDALALRDRVSEALPAWSEHDGAYGVLLGMQAFGREEAGDYAGAEESGLRALELDPHDVWAVHAVAHTYEMQARFGDGIRFYDERARHWAADNYLSVHNWWHYALYNLEAGNLDAVRRIYDERVYLESARTVAIKMCDASALLWRMYLDGHEERARFAALADTWRALVDEPCYAFNDMHAVMAFVGAGDFDAAEELVFDRDRYLATPRPGVSNYAMTTRIGLPVCRALIAFGRGDHCRAVELLMPIRYNLCEFGGSHAQRDAVLRTLVEAALRGSRCADADLLLRERLAVKPGSPYNWVKRSALCEVHGDSDGAAEARRVTRELIGAAGLV